MMWHAVFNKQWGFIERGQEGEVDVGHGTRQVDTCVT